MVKFLFFSHILQRNENVTIYCNKDDEFLVYCFIIDINKLKTWEITVPAVPAIPIPAVPAVPVPAVPAVPAVPDKNTGSYVRPPLLFDP